MDIGRGRPQGQTNKGDNMKQTTTKKPAMMGLSSQWEIDDWMASNAEEAVYHTGLLMADRQRDRSLDALAKRMWELYELGRVTLYQRRIGDNYCAYIAGKIG
jgi:hypothetical protein